MGIAIAVIAVALGLTWTTRLRNTIRSHGATP